MVINIDQVMLKIDIADCQPTELRNTHAGMKQDINDLIVFAVAVIIMDKLQEFLHLVPGDGLSGYAVVYHHSGELKAEGTAAELKAMAQTDDFEEAFIRIAEEALK